MKNDATFGLGNEENGVITPAMGNILGVSGVWMWKEKSGLSFRNTHFENLIQNASGDVGKPLICCVFSRNNFGKSKEVILRQSHQTDIFKS